MIKNFREPFYEVSERDQLNEINKQFKELQTRLVSIYKEHVETGDLYQRLKTSDLEIEETKKERQKRLKTLEKKIEELTTKERELLKVSRVLEYQRESIEYKVSSRYTETKNDDEILSDVLEIIKAVTFDDLVEQYGALDLNEWKLADMSDIVCFSYCVSLEVIGLYISYFKETKNTAYLFKTMKCLYDRSLELFPDGFTDQDKKNEYCIFDDKFFKTLTAWNKKQADKKASREYELSILADYRPEINRHILPSNTKITSTMYALGYLGTEPHQMTIDEYLQSNKANDLVTFKGLADDGLQFVFNENVAKKDTVIVSFKNLENARGGGTAPSIVFAMVLEKMTSLGYFVAPGIDTAVTISVKELIEQGDYANWRSAKRALEQAEKTCDELLINFYNKKTKMNVNSKWFSTVGFKDKGTLLLSPNKDINWKLVGMHFAIYPIYLYKLKTHAYKLAYYVFTQARINKPIDKNGDITFRLSLTSVGRELGLPSVETIKNFKYKQNFLDKVITAMKEIEDADTEFYKDHRLVYLKLDHAKNQSPKEIIETGYLVVTIKKGDVTETYQMIRDRQIDLIDSARRKSEKAKRKAREQSEQT